MAVRADTQWLEKRRQGWYVVQYVPAALHPQLGKKLRRSLGTRDVTQARQARFAVLAEFRKLIQNAEADAKAEAKRPAPSPADEEAEGWREALAASRQVGAAEEEEGIIRDALEARVQAIARKQGRVAAASLGAVFRDETPLLQYVPAWLREGGQKGSYEARTKAGHERNLAALKAWLEAGGIGATVEAVDRRTAGRYVSECLALSGLEGKTQGSIVSSLRSYWTFLARKGAVKDDSKNPWDGQAPARGAQNGRAGDRERAFTDDEVARLLAGPVDQELADLMRVAALSGMRIDEPYRLEVRDCAGGVFNIRRSKTAAGVRKVPIHPALAAIVARRSEGKPKGAFLFHEAGPLKEGRERSMAVSKRFGHYRKRPSVAVDEPAEGRRRGLVNFHSFRRWFITAVGRAGQPERVIGQVVGHKPQGITMGLYFGGDEAAALRACVEAVILPSK